MAETGTTNTQRALYEDPAIHQKRWYLLAILNLSLVLVVLSVSSLNVAIPTLQRDLSATATQLQWIVTSYAIVFAGLLLTAGAIGDRFGRRGALQAGLALFLFGSLVAGFASGSSQIIVGRVIMGVGAAFVMPATLSLIATIFPPDERARAIAIWAGFAGAGGAFGPIITGILLTGWWIVPSFSWASVFFYAVPIIIVLMILIFIFLPTSRDEDATPLDPVGAILSIVGFSTLLYGVIEGPERGWTDPLVVGSFVVAAIVLALFCLWEYRTTHPMLPLEFFRNRRFSVGVGVITFAFFGMFGFFFLFTQYLQFVRGYSALQAGVATLPIAFAIVLVSPRSAALTEKYGMRIVVSVGFLFLVAGFGLLATISPDTSYYILAVILVLFGAGIGISAIPGTNAIMESIPQQKAGVGSAVNDTTREVGGALGIGILGSIAASYYRSSVNIDQLPEPARSAAGESIGAALQVAAQLPPVEGAALVAEANRAFTDAFNLAMGISAVVAAVAAIGVWFIIQGRQELAAASDAGEERQETDQPAFDSPSQSASDGGE